MNDFTNRIAAQRNILSVINKCNWNEKLFGLSSGAISRWANINNLNSESDLVKMTYHAASKLFFLANKSQEQITDEYKILSNEIADLTNKIKGLV